MRQNLAMNKFEKYINVWKSSRSTVNTLHVLKVSAATMSDPSARSLGCSASTSSRGQALRRVGLRTWRVPADGAEWLAERSEGVGMRAD